MWAIDWSRHRAAIGIGWLAFAAGNIVLTFLSPGQETIPYHLAWASFALVYGLCRWPRTLSWSAFTVVTVATGIALVRHAIKGVIGWEECAEIVLMAAILALLMWHVDRQRTDRDRLVAMQIAERNQAAQRDMFARFGSHEVRTRLAIARGHAEIIADGAADPEVAADARIAIGELDKATETVTNILTLVRVVQPPSYLPVDIDELVDRVLRRWSGTAARCWSSTSTVGVIDADPERLEMLLDCLLENAVKFTSPDDVIAVAASRDGALVSISVRDEGSGIAPEDIGRIFELFATGTGAGSKAGTGIGLPIVKAIVDARGGTISVASEIGARTVFTICLPVDDGVTALPALPTPELSSPIPTG